MASLVLFSCSKMTHEDYVVQAESKMQKGEYSAAILAMKSAISEAPEDASLRVRLGQIYLGLDLYREAEKELSRAVALGASKSSTYRDLMKSLYLQNKHEDVVLLASKIDANIQDPELKVYEALSLMEQESYSQAIKIRNALPDSNEKTFIKAYIHANQGRFDEAKETLVLLPTSYNNEEMLMLKAKLAYLKGNNKSAITFFKEYLEIRPNNFRARVYLANSHIAEKNLDKASEAIKSAEAIASGHPLLSQLKAELSLLEEDYAASKLHSENAIAKGFVTDKVQTILAVASFKTGAYETSYEALEKIPDLVVANRELEKLELLLKIELGYPIEFKGAKGKKFDADFSELVSFNLLKRGHFDEASSFANFALEGYENKKLLGQPEQVKQATLQLAFGKRLSGVKNLEQIIDKEQDSNLASLILAMNYFSRGKYQDAVDESEKGIAKDKRYVPLYSVALQSYLRLENQEQAALLAERLRKLAPDHETIALYDVSQELKRDNFQAAKIVLDKFSSKYGLTDKLKALLFSLNEKTGSQKDNLDYFSSGNKNDLLSSRLSILSHVNAMDAATAEALLEKYAKQRKDAFYYDVLTKIQLTENDLQNALITLSEWSKSAAQNELSFIKLINVYDAMGNEDKAFAESSKATNLFPESEALALLYAHFSYRLNDVGNLSKGIGRLSQLNRKNETLPKLQGFLLVMKGDLENGLPILEKNYLSQPSRKSLSEIISVLNNHGGISASLDYLDKAISRFPSDMILLQYYADAYLPRDANKAIPAYKTVLEKMPNNVSALNNLAWLLNKTGDTKSAVPLIEKAYALDETNVSVISTYAGVLLNTKKFGQAVNLLEALIKGKKAVSVTTVLNYAEALIQVNRKKEAKRVLSNISVDSGRLKLRKQALLESTKSS